MPPRRNRNINDVYEHEFEERIMAKMEERLDEFVDQLVDRMNDMMNPRRREDRNGQRSEGEDSENPFFEGDCSSSDEQPDRPRRSQREDNRHDGVANDDYEEALVFDDDQYEEEIVSGDVRVNLMVRRSCLTPKAVGDDWLKHNIFQSTCTILNRPKPYKLHWLKKGGEVTVSKRVLVTFSVGITYKDSVWCDMVPMDACHLLLGRPWEYDRNTTHNGRANTYSFMFGGVNITLMSNKPKELVNKPTGTLLSLSQFEDELEMGDEVHRVVHDNLVRANSK
ncbi:hypothetical protein Tco_0008545 [Tanacetum coccineum]